MAMREPSGLDDVRQKLENDKAIHEFRQWWSEMLASQARHVRLFERDADFQAPVHLTADEAVDLYLKTHPTQTPFEAIVREEARRRGTAVFAKRKVEDLRARL